MDEAFIDYDTKKLEDVRQSYLFCQGYIKGELPNECDWDRPTEVKKYLKKSFAIELNSVKISHVSSFLDGLDHDSPAFDCINGYVLYLKIKYTLKNYIDCIFRHQESGRVLLRWVNGNWVLPNKQPISENPEIKECVISTYIPKRRE